MKITRLEFTDYKSIKTLERDIPAHGVMISGPSKAGKTSVLEGIVAALTNRGFEASDIRLDQDRMEVMVAFDEGIVAKRSRSRTAKASSFKVLNKDGDEKKKPKEFIDKFLGGALMLDPLAIFRAAPKDRRSIILAALPIKVTQDQLRAWVPDLADHYPKGVDVSGHGIDVLAGVRQTFFEARAAAKLTAAAQRDEANRAVQDALARAADVQPGALSVPDAVRAVTQADLAIGKLHGQRDAAAKQAEAQAVTRDRVAVLRAEATESEATVRETAATLEARGVVVRKEYAEASDEYDAADSALKVAQARMERAASRIRIARTESDGYAKLVETARSLTMRAADLHGQADMLAQSLAASAIAPVPEEAITAAEASLKAAQEARANAERAKIAKDVEAQAARVAAAAEASEARVKKLDAAVKTLTEKAPVELLQASGEGIRGLTFGDDGEVYLDRKSITRLCGTESMDLSVELAKRLDPGLKILLCDGLEKMDSGELSKFVKMATRGGWQLLGTRVDDGEFVIEDLRDEDVA